MLLVLLCICKRLITKIEHLYNQPLANNFLCKDIPSTSFHPSFFFFFFSFWQNISYIPVWEHKSLGNLSSWQQFLINNVLSWCSLMKEDILWNEKRTNIKGKKEFLFLSSKARAFKEFNGIYWKMLMFIILKDKYFL